MDARADRWIVTHNPDPGHCNEGHVVYCRRGETVRDAWEAAVAYAESLGKPITHITVMPKMRHPKGGE